MRIGLLANPRHRRAPTVAKILAMRARTAGHHIRTSTTTPDRPGDLQTGQLMEWGADLIVVLGGDGTMRAVASALAGSPLPILLVPTGSANVLARHIGLWPGTRSLDIFAEVVRTGAVTTVDLPVHKAQIVAADGRATTRDFLLMAGMGGDAAAVAFGARIHLPGALQHGPLKYVCGGLRALMARGFGAEVVQDDHTDSGMVWAVMGSSVVRPAGPVPIFPDAEVGARRFATLRVLATESGLGPVQWAGIARDGLLGAANPLLDYARSTDLRVHSDSPQPVHLDGEALGAYRELSVTVGTTTISVVCGERCRRSRARSRGQRFE